MTTIALKDDIIAADTQLTMDDVKLLSSDKIVILNKNTIIAAAGDTNAIYLAQKFFSQEDWETKYDNNPHDRPILPRDKDDENPLDAILIYKGQAYLVDRYLLPELSKHPFIAVGSGWKFAMAAMHSGLSAVAAVEFASEFDIYTNNKVRWLNVKEFQENARTKSRRATSASRMDTKEERGNGKKVS